MSSATGATSIILQGGQLVYNPLRYGAVGGGEIDDTDAVLAAIAACKAAGGGKVWLQTSHLISQPIVIDSGAVSIVGAGAQTAGLVVSSAFPEGATALTYRPSVFTTEQAGEIDGFYIEGSAAPASVVGLEFGDLVGLSLGILSVRNFSAAGSVGVQIANRTHWTERTDWRGVSVTNCTVGIRWTVAGGTTSWSYNRVLDARIIANAGQTGWLMDSGGVFESGILTLLANFGGSGCTLLHLTGDAQILRTAFAVQAEADEASATALQIDSGSALWGSGLIDTTVGGAPSVNDGTLQFSGWLACPGIHSPDGEGGSALGGLAIPATVAGSPYPSGPSVWSDGASLHLAGENGSIVLEPDAPGSATGAVTATAAGVLATPKNTLDDGSGNLSAAGKVAAASAAVTGDVSVGGHLEPTWTFNPAGSPGGGTPVSGTTYQNTSGGPILVAVPVLGGAGAGTVQLYLGPATPIGPWGGAQTVAAGAELTVFFTVPQDWYWSIVVGGGTAPTIEACQAVGM